MNPYSSPEAKQSTTTTHNSLNNELNQLVTGWERMRILYNVILLVTGVFAIVLLIRTPYFKLEESILSAIAFGIFANVCFFAGPLIEAYIRVMFNTQNAKPLRTTLFIIGTIISLLPMFIAVLSTHTSLLPAIN